MCAFECVWLHPSRPRVLTLRLCVQDCVRHGRGPPPSFPGRTCGAVHRRLQRRVPDPLLADVLLCGAKEAEVCHFSDYQLPVVIFPFLPFVEPQLQSRTPRERAGFWRNKTDDHRTTPRCWQHRQRLYPQGGMSVCQVSLNLLTHMFSS